MNDVNTYVEETVASTTVGNNWEEDVRIRSLKTGDIFDTAFFGTNIRSSVVIYIFILLSILSLFLPFTNNTLLTKGTTSSSYDAIEPVRNKDVSPLFWSDKYSSNGFEVILGKTVDFTENNGMKAMRLPSDDDKAVRGIEFRDITLYLSYGSLLGALIPLLFIYAAILIASREQWTNGNGFLFAGICCIVATLMYGYVYIDICGGVNDLFIKSKYGAETSKVMLDVFSRLGIGYWVGIALSIITGVFCFIAKSRVKSGNKAFISKKNKVEYEAAIAANAKAAEVVTAE